MGPFQSSRLDYHRANRFVSGKHLFHEGFRRRLSCNRAGKMARKRRNLQLRARISFWCAESASFVKVGCENHRIEKQLD